MEFKLNDFHYNTPEEEFLNDLKRVSVKLGRNNFSSREYNEVGKYTSSTIHVRFGTWNNALLKAGLDVTLTRNISIKELFENIEKVWISLGSQPTFRDMRKPLSNYSAAPYESKFGSWRKALEAFVEFINSANEQDQETTETEPQENTIHVANENEIIFKHKTKRAPSERLKVQVLMRDGNKCRLCGVTVTGENIHFDHIIPWSKGGETVLENIQVLCAQHNLAKGNLEYN